MSGKNEQNNSSYDDFVDIMSSSTPKSEEKEKPIELMKESIDRYGNGMFKYMGGIVKFIAFMICFLIIILSFVAGFFFYSKASSDIVIAIAIIGAGCSVALITLFMIYSVGHLICQNNEIITRLNKLLKK